MQKEYGKLTADQFRQLVETLPEIRSQRVELSAALAASKEKLDQILVGGYNWGEIYEYSFVEHVSIAVVAFSFSATLSAAVASDDPTQHLLDRLEPPDDPVAHPAFEQQDLLGLAYSLQRTILSIMLFQRSLSGLVEDVREHGNLDSMFNAIRVDRAVMSCTTFADKIARAELRQDKLFFLRLRNALKGPSQKHWAAYCDLRYSLFVLRELGFDSMSDAQLEKLLVHTLKVYPDTPAARKNLRAQYQRSKKLPTT